MHGGWKGWAAAVEAAAAGEPEGSAELSASAVRKALQAALQQLEQAFLSQSVGGLAADGDSSPEPSEQGGSVGEGGSGPASPAEGVPRARSQVRAVAWAAALRRRCAPGACMAQWSCLLPPLEIQTPAQLVISTTAGAAGCCG